MLTLNFIVQFQIITMIVTAKVTVHFTAKDVLVNHKLFTIENTSVSYKMWVNIDVVISNKDQQQLLLLPW